MIIRSQDKTMIINFSIASNFYKQGSEIWVNTFHGIAKIGTYSTEEKAIKVLDMIEIAYEEANSVCNMSGFVANTVFQMPADNEVEV